MDSAFPSANTYDVDQYDDVVGWQLDIPSRLTTLPPELLADIFLLAMDTNNSNRVSPNMSQSKVYWRYLLFYMSICKYWRNVIFRTNILWRNVQFGDGVPHSATEKMLQRSGITPLHLDVCYKDSGEGAYIQGQDIEFLASSIFRVKKMHIRVIHLDRERLKTGVENAPQLQELKVEVLDTRNITMPIPLVSPDWPLPHLETLHSLGAAYHHISAFFRPTLRRLHLQKSPDAFCPPVSSVLRALQEIPLLEELTTIDFSSQMQRALDTKEPLSDVTLPHLKKLHIENIHTTSAEFLEHISFPDWVILSRQVKYKGNTGHESPFESPESYAHFWNAMFKKLTGPSVLHSGASPTIDKLKLEVETVWEGSVHAYDESLSSSEPIFFGTATQWAMKMAVLHFNVFNAMSVSMRANIRTLTITIGFDYLFIEKLGRSLIFNANGPSSFPNLETLHLESCPETWWCLVDLHRRRDAQSHFPFPKLRVLTLDQASFRTNPDKGKYPLDQRPHRAREFLGDFRSMLQKRKTAGIPIRVLRITNAACLKEEDVVVLREYVDELQWDGLWIGEDRYVHKIPH